MSKLAQIRLLTGLIVLFSGLMVFSNISQGLADGGIVLSVTSMTEFEAGQYPTVNGKVTDSNGNPLSNVEIQVNFPSRTKMTTTDSTGEFSSTSSVPSKSGQYVVAVYATKDKMGVNTQIEYKVKESQKVITPVEIPKAQEIKQNPSPENMLKKIEEQKISYAKQKVIAEDQQKLKEQRQNVQETLQKDLKSNEKQNEPYTARNAFLNFLKDIDNSVKSIFWNQFLFTEKITDKGQEAREKALNEGKTPLDAMKEFQKEASVTRNKVIEHNESINIKYGNATADIQNQFDDEGKIPRK